jgi:hypothetical protein
MSEADADSLVICPRLASASLSVAAIVAIPTIFVAPLFLYANTLPPRPAGGIFVQRLEQIGIVVLCGVGIGSLWALDCLVLGRRQWRISAAGIDVRGRRRALRHISWAEVTCLDTHPFGIMICAGRRCEVLNFADSRDRALLKQWHNRYRGGRPPNAMK